MKERDRARGTETGDRGAIFHVTGGPPSFACHQFNSLVKFIESHILRYFAHLQWYSTEATHTHTHIQIGVNNAIRYLPPKNLSKLGPFCNSQLNLFMQYSSASRVTS